MWRFNFNSDVIYEEKVSSNGFSDEFPNIKLIDIYVFHSLQCSSLMCNIKHISWLIFNLVIVCELSKCAGVDLFITFYSLNIAMIVWKILTNHLLLLTLWNVTSLFSISKARNIWRWPINFTLARHKMTWNPNQCMLGLERLPLQFCEMHSSSALNGLNAQLWIIHEPNKWLAFEILRPAEVL